MTKYLKRHKETLLVALLGFVVFAAMNVMVLFYHYDLWTNPKVGYWSAFWNRFEVSGFDPYTYIVVSQWRPLYVLSRHPLLAFMVWPLSELNEWLRDLTGINCAIHIVSVVWTMLATASWILMYKIQRQLLEMDVKISLLLTTFFFSFSHILLVTFVEDHMGITLPLLLLSVYWGGMAIKQKRKMPLWQSLPLLFVATSVTTTNCVKVGLADLFTRWGKEPFWRLFRHFLTYLLPLAVIGVLYVYQNDTTQMEEKRNIEHTVSVRAKKDSVFAKKWEREKAAAEVIKSNQLIHISFVTNTDYKIDRLPSLVENIFGEGFILHENYSLLDPNKKHRPVLVLYEKKWLYAIEAGVVLLFLAGIWYGRRERLMWMTLSMFLFDMLLHVGLNFASADAYIMTAHWAFVIPIAVAYLIKRTVANPKLNTAAVATVLFLTVFMFLHNMLIILKHILG